MGQFQDHGFNSSGGLAAVGRSHQISNTTGADAATSAVRNVQIQMRVPSTRVQRKVSSNSLHSPISLLSASRHLRKGDHPGDLMSPTAARKHHCVF